MRKTLLIMAVILVLLVWLFVWRQEKGRSDEVLEVLPETTTTPIPPDNLVKIDGVSYVYDHFQLLTESSVTIIPNFEKKKPSQDLTVENNCEAAINAGFYTEGGQPLGLFFAEGKWWSQAIPSQTFNGFVVRDSRGGVDFWWRMETEKLKELIDRGEVDFAFQTGPLYDLQSNLQPNFIDKKFARRHLAAKDGQGEIYFFTIYEKGSLFNGPRLEDILKFFNDPLIESIADFQEVINLDGGSASFFANGDRIVNEASWTGALICMIKR